MTERLRHNLTIARVALERITEQTHDPCQCDDHNSPDCCRFAKDFCCPECIAQGALDEIDKT